MITLYLFENTIIYKLKGKTKEYVLPKKAMKYGKVRNAALFSESLLKLFNENHLLTFFNHPQVVVILPIHFEVVDKEIIRSILLDLGIKKMQFVKEVNLYEIKNNQVIVNINKTYITIVSKRKNKMDSRFYPVNIFSNINDAFKYINASFSTKYIFKVIGSNNDIPRIVAKYLNSYYYLNYKTYLLDKETNFV